MNMHSDCPLDAFSCIPYNENSDCDTGLLINEGWSDNVIITIFAGAIDKIVL
jgi:hypothetical protein